MTHRTRKGDDEVPRAARRIGCAAKAGLLWAGFLLLAGLVLVVVVICGGC